MCASWPKGMGLDHQRDFSGLLQAQPGEDPKVHQFYLLDLRAQPRRRQTSNI